MAAPIDADWASTQISDANLNKTTYGQGTTATRTGLATWPADRVFWDTDTNLIYYNSHASAPSSVTWTVLSTGDHDAAKITSGTLSVTRGGTGVSDPTSGKILKGAGSSAMTEVNAPSVTEGSQVDLEPNVKSSSVSRVLIAGDSDEVWGYFVTMPTLAKAYRWKQITIEGSDSSGSFTLYPTTVWGKKSADYGVKSWVDVTPITVNNVSKTEFTIDNIDCPIYFYGGQTVFMGVTINGTGTGTELLTSRNATAADMNEYTGFTGFGDVGAYTGTNIASSDAIWIKFGMIPIGEF